LVTAFNCLQKMVAAGKTSAYSHVLSSGFSLVEKVTI
jgi:hypothetical protein